MKPKIGRPSIASAHVKKSRTFRVSDAMYASWVARAKRLGVKLTNVLPPAMERELRRLERKSECSTKPSSER
jgi:hypothetical protein